MMRVSVSDAEGNEDFYFIDSLEELNAVREQLQRRLLQLLEKRNSLAIPALPVPPPPVAPPPLLVSGVFADGYDEQAEAGGSGNAASVKWMTNDQIVRQAKTLKKAPKMKKSDPIAVEQLPFYQKLSQVSSTEQATTRTVALDVLTQLGFEERHALDALIKSQNNVADAVSLLRPGKEPKGAQLPKGFEHPKLRVVPKVVAADHSQLAVLQELGFSDNEANIVALRNNENDIIHSIQALLLR